MQIRHSNGLPSSLSNDKKNSAQPADSPATEHPTKPAGHRSHPDTPSLKRNMAATERARVLGLMEKRNSAATHGRKHLVAVAPHLPERVLGELEAIASPLGSTKRLPSGETYTAAYRLHDVAESLELKRKVSAFCASAGIDFGFITEDQLFRLYRLGVFDMDGTLVQGDSTRSVLEFLGLTSVERAAKADRYARKRRDPGSVAEEEWTALLAGVDKRVLDHVYENGIEPMPGLQGMTEALHANGMKLGIASNGLTHFTRRLQRDFGFHNQIAREAEVIGEVLSGRILNGRVTASDKAVWMEELAQDLPGGGRIITGGNARNDLKMFQKAQELGGRAFAIRGRPEARAAADYAIDFAGLDAVPRFFLDSDHVTTHKRETITVSSRRMVHPHLDSNGQPVVIESPTRPSARYTWKTWNSVLTLVPGGETPEVFFGVPMKAWQAPVTPDEWINVAGQRPELETASPFTPNPLKQTEVGIVIVECDRRVWLAEPANHPDGIQYTFPKSLVEPGALPLQASAIATAYRKTGLHAQLQDVLDVHEQPETQTRIYLASRIGGTPSDMGCESQAMHLVSIDEAEKLLKSVDDLRILHDVKLKLNGADNVGDQVLSKSTILAKPQKSPTLFRPQAGESAAYCADLLGRESIVLDKDYRAAPALHRILENRLNSGYYLPFPLRGVTDWEKQRDQLLELQSVHPHLAAVPWQELLAINLFQSRHYRLMNHALRSGDWRWGEFLPELALATSGLNRLPSKKGIVLRHAALDPAIVLKRYVPNARVVEPFIISAAEKDALDEAPWVYQGTNTLFVLHTDNAKQTGDFGLDLIKNEHFLVPFTHFDILHSGMLAEGKFVVHMKEVEADAPRVSPAPRPIPRSGFAPRWLMQKFEKGTLDEKPLGRISRQKLFDGKTLQQAANALKPGGKLSFETDYQEGREGQESDRQAVRKLLKDAGFDLIKTRVPEEAAGSNTMHVTAILLPTSPDTFQTTVPASGGKPAITYRWEKIGDKKGSTPGGVYRRLSSDGRDDILYVKFPPRAIQSICEHIATRLSRDLGKPGPMSEILALDAPLVDYSRTPAGEGDPIAIATHYLADAAGDAYALGLHTDPDVATAYFEGIVADLLIGNWDAVGGTDDERYGFNLLISARKEVMQTDLGASLLTRARWDSARKPASALNELTEAQYYFDAGKNPAMAALARIAGYQAISDVPDLREQVKRAVALRERHGSWQAYIARIAPQLQSEDRDTIVAMLEARTAKLLELAAGVHPQRNDAGDIVKIATPTQASAPATWTNAGEVAVFVPEGETPAVLNGVPMQLSTVSAPWLEPAAEGEFDEPPFLAEQGKPAAGALVVESDGRIWLAEPTNQFGGHRLTFPKGRVEDGLSLRQTAIKETREELGIDIELTGWLGDFEGRRTTTRLYLARRTGGTPTAMGWESQGAHLVPREMLRTLLTHSRDLEIAGKILPG